MDVGLLARVIWRYKWVAMVGFLLAALLAVMSVAKVNFSGGNHITYRQEQQWAGYTTLFVTQPGFPLGSVGATGKAAAQPVDAGRFSSLAVIYAKLLGGDAVRQIMLKSGPIKGTVEAAALTAANDPADTLPMISVAGISDTAANATALSGQASEAFLKYFSEQQQQNHIPGGNRVVVTVLNKPGNPALLKDRSMTLPIIVFVSVIVATIALCFILENLGPRLRLMRDREGEQMQSAQSQETEITHRTA